MESILTSIVNLLVNQGLSGVVIVGLAWIVYTLWVRQEKLQDQRVDELRSLMQVLSANTIAITKNTESVDKNILVVEKIADIVRSCPK